MTFHRRGSPRAIRLEKCLGHVLELSQRPGGLFGVRGQLVLELRPAGESVLQCQRVLHVSQGRLRERFGNHSLEAGASVGDVAAKRVKPALGFLLQALEAALA